MAGRQRRREMIHQLERRLAEWVETQPEDQTFDVADFACSWVASGNTMTQLADEISASMGFDISRDMVMRYLNEGRPDLSRRLEKARRDGAHGMVDQAIKTADNASTFSKEDLQKAKQQTDVRLWVAERWNKKELGRAPDTVITVNNNTLHLDALRARQLQRSSQEKRVLEPQLSYAPARLIDAGNSAQEQADDIADVISIEPSEG